jgi:predicted amidohydrolase
MVIAIVQPDIIWEDKSKNLEKLGRIISAIPDGIDIIILPEMFNTGFSMNPGELAETPGSLTLTWMTRIAGERKCGICGSYIIEGITCTITPCFCFCMRQMYILMISDIFFSPEERTGCSLMGRNA